MAQMRDLAKMENQREGKHLFLLTHHSSPVAIHLWATGVGMVMMSPASRESPTMMPFAALSDSTDTYIATTLQ